MCLWAKKLYIKYKMRNREVSPKGEYLIKYIIDVYINFSTEETVEAYEEFLNHKINDKDFIKELHKLPKYDIIREEDKETFAHWYSALVTLCALLTAHKDRQKWIDYITNERLKNYIIEILK